MLTHRDNQFYLNGEKLDIHSGAIHYFRSFPEQWEGLLTKLKNAGLNTVETYCCWNLHEPKEGEYRFDGMLDVGRFLDTAAKVGLYAIVRPGPFVCSEWEFGGMPAWLLKDESIRLRTGEPMYFDRVEAYMKQLMPHIVPRLETNGGNVIMLAAENEYGSFGDSRKYMNRCADLMRSLGVDVPLLTCDGHTRLHLNGGQSDGAYIGLDFGYSHGVQDVHLEAVSEMRPDEPRFHAEHWIGIYGFWGKDPRSYPAESVETELRQHLARNIGFNLYMFHGGTNFGFTSGAAIFEDTDENPGRELYWPHITSYDYDSALTEWGECTPKYRAIQRVMEEHLGVKLPEPEPVPTQTIGTVRLTECGGLWDNLGNIAGHFEAAVPRSMEHYGQNTGYILYRKEIKTRQPVCRLIFSGVHDRMRVYFNGVERAVLYRNDEKQYVDVDGWMDEGGVLELLVDGLGRVNFGPTLLTGDRKGLCGPVIMTTSPGPKQILFDWDVYTLPMEKLDRVQYSGNDVGPAFYRGHFRAEKKEDCFIHLEKFTKGFVTVNGFNLGRFWNIGPQLSLYLPWPLLKDENEIVVFDEEGGVTDPEITILDRHILDQRRGRAGADS